MIGLLGTCDSKLHELLNLREKLQEAGAIEVCLIDVGRTYVDHPSITISQREIAQSHPGNTSLDVSELPRGEVIKYMTTGAIHWLKKHASDHGITGVIAAGGSGGTTLAASVMREAFPIGFPKLIVSTVASGDTGPLVGETDIAMIYSVVDVAGRNWLLDSVFENAAGAIIGMARTWERRKRIADESSLSKAVNASQEAARRKKRVAITMFGVTTPCVDQIRSILTSTPYQFEVLVFHSTGHGGKAMERLIRDGQIDAVLDVTTTEICDHVCGGVMSAGPDRLDAALKARIPCVISVGATDMVNFGPIKTVPAKYEGRKLYEHNSTVTLMRTNKDESVAVGKFIADKIRRSARNRDMVRVVFPLGGVSMISTAGGPFEDSQADAALRRELRSALDGSGVTIEESDKDINDGHFSEKLVLQLVERMEQESAH